ncbi:MAG: YjbQ family protein [Candidatus Latescibacterota bacterium]|nr:MAG: YjbQ family protein [Candidatus Latescibacterota bacterium]RKY72161.1 MAG: YjbQ family protein [Candidatus Latescibacterota bacterium]
MINQISVTTSTRSEFVDITDRVQEVVYESGITDGLCCVYVPHTTAGLTINENADPSVRKDILTELEKNIPWQDNYSHTEGNAAAHIKASLMGFSQTIFVENRRLVLGTWQGIFLCEFDGPRHRRVLVRVEGK